MSRADGSAAATGLLEMVELFATARFGETAAFSPSERFFIETPLARLIERYGGIADQYSALIDPALVICGVGLYIVRLVALAQTDNPQQPSQPPLQPQRQPPSNGNANGSPQDWSKLREAPPPTFEYAPGQFAPSSNPSTAQPPLPDMMIGNNPVPTAPDSIFSQLAEHR